MHKKILRGFIACSVLAYFMPGSALAQERYVDSKGQVFICPNYCVVRNIYGAAIVRDGETSEVIKPQKSNPPNADR